MWSQFIDLFSGYGTIAMMVMIFGLLFCMVEVIIPGFGVFGILGTIFTFGGMVSRIIIGVSGLQILVMFIFVAVVVVFTMVAVSILARLGLLGKISIVQSNTAVPVDYEKSTKEQRKLIGKIGFANTVFNPSGKLILNGEVYDAISDCEYIEKGEKIKVVSIKNNTILVKRV